MENVSSPESIILACESTDETPDEVLISNTNDDRLDKNLVKSSSTNEQANVIFKKESISSENSHVESHLENESTINEEKESSSVELLSDDIHLCSDQQRYNLSDDKVPDFSIVPKINCPEKIIFSIDLSTDMIDPPFIIGNNAFCPLVVVKRAVEMFVYSKSRIDNRHEFSFMSFHETAKWVKDFTNDPQDVIQTLDLMNEIKFCAECPLASILSLLATVAIDLPSFSAIDSTPPPFILRVILIYGRSNCIPQIEESLEVLNKLKLSPYFFIDILYIHEPPSPENKCEEIYERLCLLDPNCFSYIYEVEPDVTKLHNCMAKLLAHPLLRPLQKNACYELKIV